MVKKDELDHVTESLRGEIAAIRTSLSYMKNEVIQALREENISLKNRIKTLEGQFESSNITRNKMDQHHCVKSNQIRAFFWSVFSCFWTVNLRIQPEYRKITNRKNSVFGHSSRSV